MIRVQRLEAGRATAILTLLTLALLTGCTSTKVSNREKYEGGPLPRSERILVYDFGFTPADVPAESGLTGKVEAPPEPPSEDELKVAQELGVEVAKKLVEEIQDMGLPAVRATDEPPPIPTDIMIRGYFLTIDQGSALKRIIIGFGSGSAELTTFVEGYQMTPDGPRLLGSGDITSGSRGGSPGVVIPIAVTIATANPIGLAVGAVVKGGSELAGVGKISATAEHTAEKIAEEIKPQF